MAGVPTLGRGVPNLGGRGTYPGWGVPTLGGGEVPTLGGGLPTKGRYPPPPDLEK